MHYGLDFSIKIGTPIYATADGKAVVVKTSFGGFGKHIYLDHGNGYRTVYAHLDKFNVKRGQKVKRGELIAYSGNSGRSTAPHLHYEVHKSGKKVNPINFFFNDLTPSQYEEVIKIASVENQALGSTY
jgi:murein DD-endopeptidase MepM/ murein hydrolase activator NlpD